MKTIKTLFTLSIMVLIPFGYMIWIRTHQSSGFASTELILCPEPECKECRTEIMTKLGDEIDFWYKKFDGWISKQEKKEEKV